MQELHLRCQMCLKKFTIARPANNRPPRHCPDCSKRYAAERTRLRMARMRARHRAGLRDIART